MKKILFLFIFCVIVNSLFAGKVEIKGSYKNWELLIDNKPFYIQGLCFAFDVEEKTIDKYMNEVKTIGANSIRTWGIGPETKLLLDTAAKHNIYVDVGIWLEQGNTISYIKNIEYKKKALNMVRSDIL